MQKRPLTGVRIIGVEQYMSAPYCTMVLADAGAEVEQALREAPETEQTELPPPIFVLGLFRSGTTILHRLLGEDPDNRTLPHWESFDPVHTPEGPAPRQRKLARMLRLADIISPNIKAIHPMDEYQTDECRGMFTNVFRTPQFNVQYRVGGYVDWLLAQDATIAYRHHRRHRIIKKHFYCRGTEENNNLFHAKNAKYANFKKTKMFFSAPLRLCGE